MHKVDHHLTVFVGVVTLEAIELIFGLLTNSVVVVKNGLEDIV